MKEKLKKKPVSKRLTLYHSTDQERYMLKKKKKKKKKEKCQQKVQVNVKD